MTFRFTPGPGEPLGARIVRCCHEALDEGPCSSAVDPERCQAIVSAGYADKDVAELSHLFSSCGVDMRGVLGWCGVSAVTPRWRAGQPLVSRAGWVPLAMSAADGFEHYSPGLQVEAGAIFVIHSPWHVGAFLQSGSVGDELQTAEGGGGHDGTEFHLSARRVGFWQYGRQLLGVFQPSKLPVELTPP